MIIAFDVTIKTKIGNLALYVAYVISFNVFSVFFYPRITEIARFNNLYMYTYQKLSLLISKAALIVVKIVTGFLFAAANCSRLFRLTATYNVCATITIIMQS